MRPDRSGYPERRPGKLPCSYINALPPQSDNSELGLALLIDSALPGDPYLAEMLIKSHGAGLYRFALALLDHHGACNIEEAIALTGCAIGQAISSPESFRDEASIQAWLFKLLLNRWEGSARRKIIERDRPGTGYKYTYEWSLSLRDEEILRVTRKLNDRQWAILVLTYAFGSGADCIGQMIGVQTKKIYQCLNQAETRLEKDIHKADFDTNFRVGVELTEWMKQRWSVAPLGSEFNATLNALAVMKCQDRTSKKQSIRWFPLLIGLIAILAVYFCTDWCLRRETAGTITTRVRPPLPAEVYPLYYSPYEDPQRKLGISLPQDAVSYPTKEYPVLFIVRNWDAQNLFYAMPDHFINHLIKSAHQNGYAVVLFTYRSAWEDGGPWVALNDVGCALAWVIANGAQYGLDTDRMVAFGEGYGAMLAADLALVEGIDPFFWDCMVEKPPEKPFLGVVTYGGEWGDDLMNQSKNSQAFGGNQNLASASGTIAEYCNSVEFAPLNPRQGKADYKIHPAQWRMGDPKSMEQMCLAKLLPIFWVDGQDPPFLILHGEADLVENSMNSEAFAAYLRRSGVDVDYVLLEDATHYTFSVDATDWQIPFSKFLYRVGENK